MLCPGCGAAIIRLLTWISPLHQTGRQENLTSAIHTHAYTRIHVNLGVLDMQNLSQYLYYREVAMQCTLKISDIDKNQCEKNYPRIKP